MNWNADCGLWIAEFEEAIVSILIELDAGYRMQDTLYETSQKKVSGVRCQRQLT